MLKIIVALVLLMLVLTAPVEAKPMIIRAKLTFHNARPHRKTCHGKRQTARIAAINRGKNCSLMFRDIIPFAYRDKKTGRKIFLKLSQREIGDVMGPSARRQREYHIDYYIAGAMPAKYEKCNAAEWFCKVI